MGKCLTIGVMAHVDAGKTSFSEQLLYHTKRIRKLGRVDHKDAFLDSDEMERQRGITIFSNHASFEIGENRYYLLDTPGHVDFSAEMERAMQAMDYAVLIVSCVEGIQAHTEQVWKLLKQYRIPTFFFLNKTDREGAQPEKTARQIRKKMTSNLCCCERLFSEKIKEEERWNEELTEQVAQEDEELLEHYLNGEFDPKAWEFSFAKSVKECKLYPCFSGSALQDTGIEEFLSGLDSLTLPLAEKEELQAVAWQVRYSPKKERLVFLKIQSGVLRAKEEVNVLLPDGSCGKQKVSELRLYQSERFTTVQQVRAGEICAATGLDAVCPGDEIGARCSKREYQIQPMMGAKVILPPDISARTALEAFRRLEEEDPMLGVSFEEELQEIQIKVMGEIQLEVLKQLCRQRFGIEAEFGECHILYRETISKEVIGYGHYEPLRHYAEVHLRLSPGKRGSGITFDSECSQDVLGKNWQNLIKTHIFEKKHKGTLIGAELDDVKITLLTGRSHIKHTEGGDFREATYRAIRQGLEQAKAEGAVVLLEPYYSFEISVQQEQVGRLLSDLQKMDAEFDAPQISEDQATVCGRAPAAKMAGYGREFISYTKGRGILSLNFDRYEPCKDREKVVEESGYDSLHDMANPSYSVFCAHGAGFPVAWNEVKDYIHCK